jgi:hypothetical protein
MGRSIRNEITTCSLKHIEHARHLYFLKQKCHTLCTRVKGTKARTSITNDIKIIYWHLFQQPLTLRLRNPPLQCICWHLFFVLIQNYQKQQQFQCLVWAITMCVNICFYYWHDIKFNEKHKEPNINKLKSVVYFFFVLIVWSGEEDFGNLKFYHMINKV